MSLVLAQQVGALRQVDDSVATLPNQGDYLQTLMGLHPVTAVLLVLLGLVCLLWGLKFFKLIVIANAAGLGALLGGAVGQMLEKGNPTMQLFAAIAGAALLGLAAWPLMKVAVSAMGALAGFIIGFGVWHFVARATGHVGLAAYPWVGGVIGAVGLGLLSFPAFQISIMIFTSFEGSLAIISGVVSLLMRSDEYGRTVVGHLDSSLYALPMVVLIPTLLGLVVQYTSGKKKKGGS
jgi:hypothetical protein